MTLELCWASGEERRRHIAGDELVPHPKGTITQAITINAPPEARAKAREFSQQEAHR
jgi:hypothetical protein